MSPHVLDAVLFYVFAGLALASALVMVSQRSPVFSAFSLIVTLVSLSAIFGLLGSPFIAALQLIVYAGAIMVLFLFVLMLLNVKSEERLPGEARIFKGIAIGLGALLAAQVGSAMMGTRLAVAPQFDASPTQVAQVLFETRYLYVFEATSVLILAALVGSIVLAKKEL